MEREVATRLEEEEEEQMGSHRHVVIGTLGDHALIKMAMELRDTRPTSNAAV